MPDIPSFSLLALGLDDNVLGPRDFVNSPLGNDSRRSAVVLSGFGMASSLGPDAACACAAARAGITRTWPVDEYEAFDPISGQPEPLVAHAASSLTLGFRGAGRLIRLAVPAFADLVRAARLAVADMSSAALIVVLPSGFYVRAAEALLEAELEADDDLPPILDSPPPRWPEEKLTRRFAGGLVSEVLKAHRFPAPKLGVTMFDEQAGLGRALLLALDLLARGEVDRCVIGGVDSCLDLDHLHACDALGLLKTPTNPVGFMPGEAAVFAVVEPAEHARAAGRRPLATLGGAFHQPDGADQFAREPAFGKSLGAVLGRAIEACDALGRPCGLFVGGCNGTEWVAQHWGHAVVGLAGTPPRAVHWHSAASFGETGAAAGFLGLCQAAAAHSRGYAPGASTIVWSLSADGGASAVVVCGAGGQHGG